MSGQRFEQGPHFLKDGDVWTFKIGSSTHYQTLDLAFLYDTGTGTLLRHGPTGDLRRGVKAASARLRAQRSPDLTQDWSIVSDLRWTAEEANLFVKTTGSLALWVARRYCSSLPATSPPLALTNH